MLTMRLFAEERKSGTIELLLTYPVRDGEVLAGKYLAALALYVILLGLHAALSRRSSPTSPASSGGRSSPATSGCVLTGATFLAVGVLVSSLTENQIVAGFGTFGVLLAFWIIGWGAEFAGGDLAAVLQYLSITEHIDTFSRGLIDTKDLVYYVDRHRRWRCSSPCARSSRSGGGDEVHEPPEETRAMARAVLCLPRCGRPWPLVRAVAHAAPWDSW